MVRSADRALWRGVFLGGVMVFGAGIAGEALIWFLTHSIRPEAAGPTRTVLFGLEGIFGLLIFIWSLLTARREARALRTAALRPADADRLNEIARL